MATKSQPENEVTSGMAWGMCVASGENTMYRIVEVEFAGEIKTFEGEMKGDFSAQEYAEKTALQNEGEKVELRCSVDGYNEYRSHRGWIVILDQFGKLVDKWVEDELVWKWSCSHASEWDMDLMEVETNLPWENKEAKKAFEDLIPNKVGLLKI